MDDKRLCMTDCISSTSLYHMCESALPFSFFVCVDYTKQYPTVYILTFLLMIRFI